MFYTIVVKNNRALVATSRIDIYQGTTTHTLAILLPMSFENYNPNTDELILKYITPKNDIGTEVLNRVGDQNDYYRFEHTFTGEMTYNSGDLRVQLQIHNDDSNISLGEIVIPILRYNNGSFGGTDDYEKLINKPRFNGQVLVGDFIFEEEDPNVHPWAKQAVKPSYTSSEVGAVDLEDEITEKEIDDLIFSVFG